MPTQDLGQKTERGIKVRALVDRTRMGLIYHFRWKTRQSTHSSSFARLARGTFSLVDGWRETRICRITGTSVRMLLSKALQSVA